MKLIGFYNGMESCPSFRNFKRFGRQPFEGEEENLGEKKEEKKKNKHRRSKIVALAIFTRTVCWHGE